MFRRKPFEPTPAMYPTTITSTLAGLGSHFGCSKKPPREWGGEWVESVRRRSARKDNGVDDVNDAVGRFDVNLGHVGVVDLDATIGG